jgi:hypothetical protein
VLDSKGGVIESRESGMYTIRKVEDIANSLIAEIKKYWNGSVSEYVLIAV